MCSLSQTALQEFEEAFGMLYSRFSSQEPRDRLIRQWNNLRYSDFKNKAGTTMQTALTSMCERAEMLQLQLGRAYQDNQHLRDALLKAVSNEPFAALLALTPTQDSIAVPGSLR